MNKEKKQFAEFRKKRQNEMIEDNERCINEQIKAIKDIAKYEMSLLQQQREAESDGDITKAKTLRNERKKQIRLIEQHNQSIRNLQYGIDKMSSMTEDELASAYMSQEHLYFEEFDLLGIDN